MFVRTILTCGQLTEWMILETMQQRLFSKMTKFQKLLISTHFWYKVTLKHFFCCLSLQMNHTHHWLTEHLLAKHQMEHEAIRFIIPFSNFPVKISFPHYVGVNTVCCTSDSLSSPLHQSCSGVDSHPIRHANIQVTLQLRWHVMQVFLRERSCSEVTVEFLAIDVVFVSQAKGQESVQHVLSLEDLWFVNTFHHLIRMCRNRLWRQLMKISLQTSQLIDQWDCPLIVGCQTLLFLL